MNIKEFLNKDISFGNGFDDRIKSRFYIDFHYLLLAGMDISTSLDILQPDHSNKKQSTVISALAERIRSGSSLSESMEQADVFSVYECYSVRIGEETGKLSVVLKDLSVYFAKRTRLKRQLVKVLTYPGFLILSTILVLFFMLNNIVPMFSQIFKQFGKELPPFTQKIIELSAWLESNFTVIVITLLLFISLILYFRKNRTFRKWTSLILLKVPIFGNLSRKIFLARFCHSMALLLGSRIPVHTALRQTASMIDFIPLETVLADAAAEVEKGKEVSSAFRHQKFIDRRMLALIRVSEKSNNLDKLFDQLSVQLDEEIEYSTGIVGVLIEPVLISVIGLVVGTILVAMYQPLFNLGTIIE